MKEPTPHMIQLLIEAESEYNSDGLNACQADKIWQYILNGLREDDMKEDEFRKRDTRQPAQTGAWWVKIGGEWNNFYDGPLAMQEAKRLNAVMVYGDDPPPKGLCIKTRKSWKMPDRELCLLVLMIASWGLACILGTAHAFLGVVLLEVIVISAWLASWPSET